MEKDNDMGIFDKMKKNHDKPADVADEAQVDTAEGKAERVDSAQPTPKGLSGKLKGALARSGKNSTRKLRDNERLASVIDESVPGTTVDIASKNTPFALPDNKGFVVLGLQTQSAEFGGLSSVTNKDRDKGNLVNLISAGDIHVVATEELLDADILGLIPDEQSMGHLSEFKLMREARYVWMVLRVDPVSGALQTFWIPVTDKEKMLSGSLFKDAEAVVGGKKLIGEVVDFDIIDAMLAIADHPGYDQEPNDEGVTPLDIAMGYNHEAVQNAVAEDKELNSTDFLTRLHQIFTEAVPAPHGAEQSGAARPVSANEQGGKEASKSTQSEAESVEADISADEADAIHTDATSPDAAEVHDVDNVVDADEKADKPQSQVDKVAEMRAARPATGGGRHRKPDEDEDEFAGDEFDEPEFGASDYDDAAAARAQALDDLGSIAGRGAVSTAEMTNEQISELARQVADNLAQSQELMQPAPTQQEQQLEQVQQADDRVFDADDTVNAVLRQSNDPDLGLVITEEPVNTHLSLNIPQIALPEDYPVTKWLGEQLDMMVTDFNNQLFELGTKNYQQLRADYIDAMEEQHQQIANDLDLENNNGRVADIVRAIQRDKATFNKTLEDQVTEEQQRLAKLWETQKQEYVKSQVAKAEQDWEHRNKATKDSEINRVRADLENSRDARIQDQYAQLHKLRRTEAAAQSYNASISVIESLTPKHDKYEEEMQRARNEAETKIREYLDLHREDDLHQARVNDDMLKRDTKIESILEETRARIADYEKKSKQDIAEINAGRQRDRESYKESIALIEANNLAIKESAEKQIAEAQEQAQQALKRAEEREAQIRAEVEKDTQKMRESMELSDVIAQKAVTKGKNDYRVVYIMFALAVTFMTIVGFLVGWMVFG